MLLTELREMLAAQERMLSARLAAIDRWMSETNVQLRELTRQVGITNGTTKVNSARIDAHDREFKQMREDFMEARDASNAQIKSMLDRLSAERNVTWRDARIIIAATSIGGGVIWGLVQGGKWLLDSLRTPTP